MTMKEIDSRRAFADVAIETARLVCGARQEGARCGLCAHCAAVSFLEHRVLEALRQWWEQGCKE